MVKLPAEYRERILYEDDRIAIFRANAIDEHELTVDFRFDGDPGAYCYIDRGILKDMARRGDMESFRSSMNAMNSNFVYQLNQIKMPLETIAWAFSKARMQELEEEAHYFASSKRKVRELRQAL